MKAPYFAMLLVTVAGCAAVSADRPRTIASLAASCVVTGEWTSGELEVADGSFAYASVSQAQTRIDLSASPPIAHVEVDGFSLEGSIDLRATIRIAAPTALGQNVLLPPGAEVSIASVEGDRARIGLGRFAFEASDHTDWVVVPQTIVSCSALGLGFAFRDEQADRRDRLALGLPLDPPARFVAADHALAVAATPGGPTQVTLEARDYPERVLWLEEQGGFTRIALQHWTGTTLVGWVQASELLTEEPPVAEGGLGYSALLGALAGARTFQTCHADHALTLSVRQVSTTDDRGEHVALATPASPLAVGTIAAGARFVLVETRADGTALIEGHPQGHLYGEEDAEWIVPSETFACVEETYDPSAAFAQLVE